MLIRAVLARPVLIADTCALIIQASVIYAFLAVTSAIGPEASGFTTAWVAGGHLFITVLPGHTVLTVTHTCVVGVNHAQIWSISHYKPIGCFTA